jgi:hypothetical protein
MGIKTNNVENEIIDYLDKKSKEFITKNNTFLDKKLVKNLTSNYVVLQNMQAVLDKVFSKGWYKPQRRYSKQKHNTLSRVVNGAISDIHIGSHIDGQECPVEYNVVQESRRLGKVVSQIADYKYEYRDQSKLIIHLLGDIIQGVIHDARSGDVYTYQFAAAVHYLVNAILFLCSEYKEVDVYCTPGNHGRNKIRHEGKAVDQKWDSIETMIYIAVKTAVLNAGITNCKFFIPKTPYYTVKIFDSKGFFTHGDTLLFPGNPQNSINIKRLAQQICKWNTARNIGGPFNIFCCGHIHVGSITNLPGGVTMITNGAITPPDPFTLSVGYPDNTCGQYIWESVEGHGVGDQRFIIVDGAEKDSKYNDIIPLFKGI